jgi:hypothetical protein
MIIFLKNVWLFDTPEQKVISVLNFPAEEIPLKSHISRKILTRYVKNLKIQIIKQLSKEFTYF